MADNNTFDFNNIFGNSSNVQDFARELSRYMKPDSPYQQRLNDAFEARNAADTAKFQAQLDQELEAYKEHLIQKSKLMQNSILTQNALDK
mgnify:CR=1 FL=1